MADPNYGRERPTPSHVHAHDNVAGGVTVTAAAGTPTTGGTRRPGGLDGLKPLPVGVSVQGEYGKPRPVKKAAKYQA